MTERAQFHGIYPMQYAFFNRDASLDRAALRTQTQACIAAGVHGIAILGLAQEVGKLSLAERLSVLEWTSAEVAERVPLAVTVAEPNIAGQIEFAHAAQRAGASWLILQPPPVSGVSEAALVEFFSSVMEKITLPVAIQNAPGLMANSLSTAAIKELRRRHSHFQLLKAEGPATYVEQLIHDTEASFKVFNGYAGITLPDSLRAGCAGLIPSTDTCDVQAKIYSLMRLADPSAHTQADRLHREILPILVLLMTSVENLVAYGKRLAAKRIGISEVHARAPALEPSRFGLECLWRHAAQLGQLASAEKQPSAAAQN